MENSKVKIIFHIDMNQFFCSVAEILYPQLRGKAFAIGRENTNKGVLSTASYEARKYGIHSAMSQMEAKKILPSLLIIHVDYSYYREYHNKFIKLISGYTNLIEVASIDEVYADMTEASKTKHPVVLAKEIQVRLLKEHKLPCSIGIAPTLYLAKMASDIKKPLGVTVLRKRDVKEILYPLPVSDIFGIGKKTWPKLMEKNINTIGDFMDENNKELVLSIVGNNTYNYAYNSILGHSSNEVKPDRYDNSKSISEVITFDVHKSLVEDLLIEIRRITRSVYNKMKHGKYYTRTVSITLRDSDFNTITRQLSLNDYTDDFYIIMDNIEDLLIENVDENKTYRLVGAGVSNLILEADLPKEYNLFTIDDKIEKESNINKMMKELQEKYGSKALYWKKDEK